ncbi:MAG: hypothetical protein WCH32_05760 [Pseudomonadota bacterium]
MEGLRAPMMEHRALAAPTPDPAPTPCTGRARLFALAALLLVTPLAAAATYNVTPVTYNWLPTVGHTALTTWDGSVGCPNTSGDDSLSQSLPIGFTFKFGTTSYTQLRIFSNGRVQFNNTRCSFGTNAAGPPRTYIDPMPASNLANTLRIYGADLDASTAGGGTITYATVGTAPNRTFVVSWNGVPQWSTTGQTAYNLQVQLYENGEFWFMYGSSDDTSPGTTAMGPAQLGWELSNSDYYAATGLPANNSGLRFAIVPAASLTVTRVSSVVSDPINGSSQPKRIPGSVLAYTTTVANSGTSTVDSGTLAIAEPVPANTDLYVASNPIVTFTDGSPSSGTGLVASSVTYSKQAGGGAPYTYTPVANAAGYDPLVTGIQIAPNGSMKAGTSSPLPSFSISYRVRVR